MTACTRTSRKYRGTSRLLCRGHVTRHVSRWGRNTWAVTSHVTCDKKALQKRTRERKLRDNKIIKNHALLFFIIINTRYHEIFVLSFDNETHIGAHCGHICNSNKEHKNIISLHLYIHQPCATLTIFENDSVTLLYTSSKVYCVHSYSSICLYITNKY